MIKIFATALLLFSEPGHTTPEELISIMETKEGAFETARIYGDCSAYIDTMAEYLKHIGGEDDPGIAATIDTLEGVARGAWLVGALALLPHAKASSETNILDYLDTLIETQKNYWKAIIFTQGLEDKQVAEQTNHCAEFNQLQTLIVEDYRKGLYGGDFDALLSPNEKQEDTAGPFAK